MCENCLLAEVNEEWVEPYVQMIRLDGLIFSPSPDAIDAAVICFRVTRSPYYMPLRVRATLDESMLTRRHN